MHVRGKAGRIGVALVAVLLAGVVAAFTKSGSPVAINVHGDITLLSHGADFTPFEDEENTLRGNDDCSGTNGYSDIVEGAPVTIYNASGTVIAEGALKHGVVVGDQHDGVIPSVDTYVCDFAFNVSDVPKSAFYKVEVSHRGQVTESLHDLQTTGAEMSLGQ